MKDKFIQCRSYRCFIVRVELEEAKIRDTCKNFNQDKCYKCGKVGHQAANCRNSRDVNVINNNPIKCYNCGKPGHIARNYRQPQQQKKAYNNQYNSQSFGNNMQGNDLCLLSTSHNGGSDVMKPSDYKIITRRT